MEGPPLGPGGEDITWPDQVAPRGRKASSTRKIKPQTSNLKPLRVILFFNDSGRRGRTSRTGEGHCNTPAKVLQSVTTGAPGSGLGATASNSLGASSSSIL